MSIATVGAAGQGWEILSGFLVQERIGGAALYVGNGQTALNDALAYSRERVQFGQAIGDFQAIKHSLSDAATGLEAAGLLTYQAAWLASRGEPCVKEASEAVLRLTTQGTQVLGGYAQLPEYDMERYWRDAKQHTVSSSASQIQRSIIGKALAP